jgi:ActR/RegA family two-component response regulator
MSLSNRHTLIALDEDNTALHQIEAIASPLFKIVATRSVERALSIVRTDASASVLLAAQALNNTKGVTVLRAAQSLRADLRRVLMATPDELAALIEALHSGVVERIVYKPIRSGELIAAITLAHAGPNRAIAS